MYTPHSSGIQDTLQAYKRIQDDPTEAFSDECMLHIFSYLNADELGVCSHVNKRWKRVSEDSQLPFNRKSLLSSPYEFLKVISKVKPVTSGWQPLRLAVDLIGYVGEASVELISLRFGMHSTPLSNDPVDELDCRARGLLGKELVARVGEWRIYSESNSVYLYDIQRGEEISHINIMPGISGLKASDYCHHQKFRFFLPYSENRLLVISELGVIKLWDLVTQEQINSVSFENKFIRDMLKIREAKLVQDRILLTVDQYELKDDEYIVCQANQIRLFHLPTFQLVGHNVTKRFLEFGFQYWEASINQIVCFDQKRFFASFKFNDVGCLDLDWMRDIQEFGSYDSIKIMAADKSWLFMKGCSRKKDRTDLLVFDAKSGELTNRIEDITFRRDERIWLFQNLMCHQEKKTRTLRIHHLPSLKSYDISSLRKDADKKASFVKDVYLSGNSLTVLQISHSKFRLMKFMVT